ncbi:MAG: thioredoxin [Phycisphaeraceae bacterium]|nr:thioredoxin [Phycisphaeraceae bacterium]
MPCRPRKDGTRLPDIRINPRKEHAMSAVDVVTSSEFESRVLRSARPVLVDFYADWCGPCRMLAPTLERLKQETADVAEVVKVDVDQSTDLASQYGIQSIPALLLFKDGQVISREGGALPLAQLKGMIEQALAATA